MQITSRFSQLDFYNIMISAPRLNWFVVA